MNGQFISVSFTTTSSNKFCATFLYFFQILSLYIVDIVENDFDKSCDDVVVS